MPQTLSKSRFVQGLGCPKKLVYGADKDYLNRSDEDSFLASLAQGGFQVGEFAKAHFPGGVDVKSLDQKEALAQTNELLEQKTVTIFEAAVKFENCFIRVDVLEKKGDRLRGFDRGIEVDIVCDAPGFGAGVIICLPEVIAVYGLIFSLHLAARNPVEFEAFIVFEAGECERYITDSAGN